MKFNAGDFKDIDPGERILMGPGPSDVPSRVLQAMSAPCIGHLDPYFLSVLSEVQQLLRYLFQTKNPLTIPVSGTGSAGMGPGPPERCGIIGGCNRCVRVGGDYTVG